MLTEALNEAVGLDCADIEGEAAGFLHHVGSKVRSVGYVEGQSPTIIAEKPPATVYRRDAEPLAFNAGNKNDMAHIDGRGGAVPDAASVEERHERHPDHSDALADAVAGGGTDCLNPWDNQSKRVFLPSMACPTLNRGAGMHTVPSVLVPTRFRET